MHTRLPEHVTTYFWGDDLEQLNWDQHKNYIVQTLLDKGDIHALHWLFQQTTKAELQTLLPSLRLQPKSLNFWNIYLS